MIPVVRVAVWAGCLPGSAMPRACLVRMRRRGLANGAGGARGGYDDLRWPCDVRGGGVTPDVLGADESGGAWPTGLAALGVDMTICGGLVTHGGGA